MKSAHHNSNDLLKGVDLSKRLVHEVTSPVTDEVIDRIPLKTKAEITEVLSALTQRPCSLSGEAISGFIKRLRDQLKLKRDAFFEKTYLETGFIATDSAEIIDGAIEFLSDFDKYAQQTSNDQRDRIIPYSYSGSPERTMRILHRPYRCVAALVPQNAPLSLSIIVIASALYAGSRIALRFPLQSGSTGRLLAEAIMESDPPHSSIAIINGPASDFLEACCACDEVDLIHYIGSNQYASSVLTQAFSSGKACLIDGQGNGMLYLDETLALEDAVRIITCGATRFNGETCTSVNGVLVKDSVYKSFKESLIEAFQNLKVGHPLEQGVQAGPLFSKRQALELQKTLQGSPTARLLCGGHVRGAYFTPAVVEGVEPHDPIIRDGFFGPALWIQRAPEDRFWNWFKANRFPLSDAILSTDKDLIQSFITNSRAARIVVNEDPAAESMFEPWGGYPPSGLNPVSMWIDKYRQTFLIDGRLHEINPI